MVAMEHPALGLLVLEDTEGAGDHGCQLWLLCPEAPCVSTQNLGSVCRSPNRLGGGAAILRDPEMGVCGEREELLPPVCHVETWAAAVLTHSRGTENNTRRK